jgi:hypothetical protein
MCVVELLIYFILESLKMLKQIVRKAYTVLWIEKLRDTTFSPRKKKKSIIQTNPSYNDLKRKLLLFSPFFLIFFFVMSVMKSTWE